MAEQSDILKGSQYKKSTPQERFARQLDRDLSRPSGPRLSQSTIRTLITNDTASWAKSIFDQKAAQNYGANFTSAQTQISTTSSSQSISSSSLDSGGGATMTPNEGSNAQNSEDSDLEDLYKKIEELNNRLDSASINAKCQDGTVTVTLNL